ncbi:MAG: LamG domain-containing protein, partial [Clostridia bacterium]|nr:LamG domain-containing protein [Clostridia bacterium]
MKKVLTLLSVLLLIAALSIPAFAEFDLEDFTLPESGVHFGFNGDAKADGDILTGELVGDPTFVEGRDGTANGAVYLDDNEQYIFLGKYVDAENYTASFWCKVEDNTEHVFLCSSILGSIRIIHDGGVVVGNTINGVADNLSDYTAPRNEWVNMTFVYSGAEEKMDIYANGELVGSLNGALPLPFTLLGNEATEQKGWQSYPFLTLDDAWFFPRAFTADEVKALYNGEDVGAGSGASAAAPAAGGADAAAKMFTDFESYASFEMNGDPVFNMDDEVDVADYWTGEWNGPGDTGDEKTVEIAEGKGYNGTKALAVSSNGTENVGLYLYSTAKNGIARSYPDTNYLRVWMDLSEVGFRKANYGVVNSLACLFTTDEVDGAWDCPFWFSADGVNWEEMYHGGDGCFGDAQDSDVYGLAGFFAFPLKDFTIRSSANWEAYDELTPCDPADVWGVYLFWDYSDNREPNNPFYIDNIEFVSDYKVFNYDVVATESTVEKVSYDLPEITTDPGALLDSADVYISFDDGVSDAKGHTVASVGEVASVDGISGKAVKMDSTAGYITLDGYTFGTDSFTVAGWFNTESCTGDQCLFSNKDWGSGGNPGWLVTQRSSDWKININAEGGSRTDKECGFGMIPAEFEFSPLGQWYHLAVVVDREAGTYKLYINGRDFYMPGEFTADNGFDGLAFDSGLPFNIGQDGTGAYADGTLVTTYDEFAIFKKALTHEEVAALYTLNAQEGSASAAGYPSSGADGDIINGTVIGNAEGWGGNADAGAAAAFDGNPATFFDPLGVGD